MNDEQQAPVKVVGSPDKGDQADCPGDQLAPSPRVPSQAVAFPTDVPGGLQVPVATA